MNTKYWWSIQAATLTGIPQEKLRAALLLYEDQKNHRPASEEQLMFSCLSEAGVSTDVLNDAKLTYLRLIEDQSFFGGVSR